MQRALAARQRVLWLPHGCCVGEWFWTVEHARARDAREEFPPPPSGSPPGSPGSRGGDGGEGGSGGGSGGARWLGRSGGRGRGGRGRSGGGSRGGGGGREAGVRRVPPAPDGREA